MKKWLIVFLLTQSFVAYAADSLPEVKVEQFFNTIIKGHVSSAYDELFTGSSIPKNKPQAVSLLKQQTSVGLALYGSLLGYELISKKVYGSSIIKYVYVLKSEKAPTIWRFFFYKPKNEWFLANIIFNDQFNLLR